MCWMCTVTTEAQEGSFENITKKKREGKTCKAFGGSVCFCNVIYNNFVGTYNISSHPHFIFKLMKKDVENHRQTGFNGGSFGEAAVHQWSSEPQL